MSFGSFDASAVSRSSIPPPVNDIRASSSTMTPQYDRQSNSYLGRGSPSPIPPRRDIAYSGVSPHPGLSQRAHESNDNQHHSLPRRADYISRYSRTPSPEYFPPHRDSVSDSWSRDLPWHSSRGSRWDHRISPPPTSSWNRQVSPSPEWDHRRSWESTRDSRSFEPSASWRQTHGTPTPRPELPSTSPRLLEERRWHHAQETLPPDRNYDRTGPRHDLYPEEVRQPLSSYGPRDVYSPSTPFRTQYDDPAPRVGSSYRPSNRGTSRPSALGNYKLQQRRASHNNYEPVVNPRSWGRESPTNARGLRADALATKISPQNGHDKNNSIEAFSHYLSQRHSSSRSLRSQVGSSTPTKSNRRVSSASSRSDIASTDEETDLASSRSSSRSSRSSRSHHPRRLKPTSNDTFSRTPQSDLLHSASRPQGDSWSSRETRPSDPLLTQLDGVRPFARSEPSKADEVQLKIGQQTSVRQFATNESSHEDTIPGLLGASLPSSSLDELSLNVSSAISETETSSVNNSQFAGAVSLKDTPERQRKFSGNLSAHGTLLSDSATGAHTNSFQGSVISSGEDDNRPPSIATVQLSSGARPAPGTQQLSQDRQCSPLAELNHSATISADVGRLVATPSQHPPHLTRPNGLIHFDKVADPDHDQASQTCPHPRSDAESMSEALRTAISARRKHDHQTRSQRVNPILIANLSIAQPENERISTPPDTLVSEVVQRVCSQAKVDNHEEIRSMLAVRFAERQTLLSEKSQRMREEYMSLHEQWLANCAHLDSELRVGGPREEIAAVTGRTTRRTAANLGDAVRSDLEMEQIIASLGNEDLTDPNHLAVRNIAVIPTMICVEKGHIEYLFDDTNNLVDDPECFYDSRSGFHDWTPFEEEIFYEKYAEYPKQFGYIAAFLPNKTTAQCVLYYYVHKKKLVNFRTAANSGTGKRRKGPRKSGKQKSNALLADIQEHDLENPGPKTRRRRGGLPAADGAKTSSRRGTLPPEANPELDPRPKRRRVSATAKALAAKELEGEDDASVDTECNREPSKKARRGRKPKIAESQSSALSSVSETKFIDVNETLGRRRLPATTSYWSITDKDEFLRLLARHGKNFKRIAASMPNKTTIQVSNYYKSHLIDLDLEKIASAAQSRSPSVEPLPRDPFVNGTHLVSLPSTVPGTPPDLVPMDSPLADITAESDSKSTEQQTPPWNDTNESIKLNGFQMAQEKLSTKERQIRFLSHPPTQNQHPQKGFMSVLHPSSFRVHSPLLEASDLLPPAQSSLTQPVSNPIHPSPFAPSSFQFSAYKPPSISPLSHQSQLRVSPGPPATERRVHVNANAAPEPYPFIQQDFLPRPTPITGITSPQPELQPTGHWFVPRPSVQSLQNMVQQATAPHPEDAKFSETLQLGLN